MKVIFSHFHTGHFRFKKRKSKNRKPFSNEAKKYLLDRDIGKWHEQDTIEHRQKLLNTDGVDSETIRTAVAPPKVKPCASAQKIDAARQHMWMDAESEVSESEDEDDESENGDPKHGHLGEVLEYNSFFLQGNNYRVTLGV